MITKLCRWWTVGRVALAFVLGLATTLAIGLGAGWYVDPGPQPPVSGPVDNRDGMWSLPTTHGFGVEHTRYYATFAVFGPAPAGEGAERSAVRSSFKGFLRQMEPGDAEYTLKVVVRDTVGWPFPALESYSAIVIGQMCEIVVDCRGGRPFARAGRNSAGQALEPGSAQLVALPLSPVWGGLLVNTALFCAGWWLVLWGPGWLRTMRRKRSGLCPACGYDLRGEWGGGCPECGWNRAAATAIAAGSATVTVS
ncbi:MAG: hypothetical protein ACREJO_11210 [Phycisphaerales bacterium]